MDRYEYKLRSEEIEKLMEAGKYAEAARLADTIDWRRVKSVLTLSRISDLYRTNKRFEEARDILLIAYDRNPGNRNVVAALCEISLEFDDIINAVEYFKEFAKLAPRDTETLILRYKIYVAQNVGIEEKIELLEEIKKRDRIEEWEYELAYCYHRAGLKTECVEECDEIILWFGEGSYVMKAMDLKMCHEPLTPEQQAKYDAFCNRKVENGAAISEPNEDGVDFRVDTVNVGINSTINLQKELAENLREVIEDDEWNQESADNVGYMTFPGDTNPEAVNPETIQSERVAALENTIPADAKEVFFEDKTGDIRFQLKQPQPAAGVDPRLEEFKKNFSGFDDANPHVQIEPQEGQTYAKVPVKTVPMAPFKTSIQNVTEVYFAEKAMNEAAAEMAAGEIAAGVEGTQGLDNLLSQGADGQISLVVPDERKPLEKQITGQLNISDLLAEWEKTKKDNERKRQEAVRQSVLEKTGRMFTDFDESTKSDWLERLDSGETMSEVIPEAGIDEVDTHIEVITEEDSKEEVDLETPAEDIVSGAAAVAGAVAVAEAGELSQEAALAEEAVAVAEEVAAAAEDAVPKFYGSVTSEIPGSIWKEVEAAEAKAETEEDEDATNPEVVSLEEGSSDETFDEEAPGVDVMEATDITSEDIAEESAEETEGSSDENRDGKENQELSPEEEELFEPFLYSSKMRKQIANALENISLASYAGNVIIAGEPGSGAMYMAKCLVRQIQLQDNNFSGNVAKITGETLNRKDVTSIISKLANGALIVERANGMSEETIANMIKQINQEGNGVLILLIDRKKEVQKLLEKNASLNEFFSVKMNILPMNNDVLVEYGKRYAYDSEYSIDAMGVLALYKRISDMQTGKHAVTVMEVKKIVDEAIRHSKKKTISHFAGVLSGKRYDDEDMIILKENDFIQ